MFWRYALSYSACAPIQNHTRQSSRLKASARYPNVTRAAQKPFLSFFSWREG